ncbi:hypothetical protein GW17_00055965 [Ensete ventricosum]|nr:hypothetical protein GW17_00055965 [Ensete ventricosum]
MVSGTERLRRGTREEQCTRELGFSPSSSFSLPQLIPVEIDCRLSISAIPPGSRRFAYQSAGGPVRTARYEALPPGKANLD